MAAPEAVPRPRTTSTGANRNGAANGIDDPFAGPNAEPRRASHRYSAFDLQSFAQNQSSASPSTARRALEAHLSETDRRLQEASQLGQALVQQRHKITDRLKEVEQLQNEREIGPELKQKLVEVEKEYHELGRDTVRASMAPKGRHVSTEDAVNGQVTASGVRKSAAEPDFANVKVQRPASPTKFSSQAVDSPSKMNVPSRKQRNQPANRVHDIEFVTDISTSLLAQVRQLQGVLTERDEAIKSLTSEKSQLELESRGLNQRLKSLNDSEQRYKDENWSLETQTQDLTAAAKDHASKEQKLQAGLAAALAEKSSAQRELDEVKQALGKLGEDHTLFRKNHETELAGLRKNHTSAETSRDLLQKKVEDLTSQNEELAKAVAGRYRFDEGSAGDETLPESEDLNLDRSDLEHSPPPSPQKQPARSGVLESETLKSSLQHAHRMIQSLKNGIRQEKSEKTELKRLLQESRDELETRRNDLGASAGSRSNKAKSQQGTLKKLPRQGQLGSSRSGRIFIEEDDPEWEEHAGEGGPRRMPRGTGASNAISGNASEAYQTSAETDAFETANERESATETEAFQTGAESMADESSGDVTETETGTVRDASARTSRPSLHTMRRPSNMSTASTSDEEGLGSENTTPHQPPNKYRFKLGRGSRKSRFEDQRFDGTPTSVRDSPASAASSGTPQGPSQSLFAELGDLGGEGSEDEVEGTPSKVRGATLSPESIRTKRGASLEPVRSKVSNSDAGTMTEPLESPIQAAVTTDPGRIGGTPVGDRGPAANQQHGISEPSSAAAMLSETPRAQQEAGALPEQPSSRPTLTEREAGGVPAAAPQLSLSKIYSTEIIPSKAELGDHAEPRPSTAVKSDREQTPPISEDKKDVVKGGLIGSVLGWAVGSKANASNGPQKDAREESDDERPERSLPIEGARRELNGETTEPGPTKEALNGPGLQDPLPKEKEVTPAEMSDQGSQTALSASQIERLLAQKDSRPTPVAAPSVHTPTKPRSTSFVRESSQPSPALATRASLSKDQPPTRAIRRPNSSASVRASSSDEMPPLPADHQQAIAAAQQTPSRARPDSTMGPPITPASAYRPTSRRPQTPQEQNIQSPGSATPRARYSTARSTRSRRSSVSSFESELDARFNIRADGMPVARSADGNTDPRMIQAITQTMIGEYLWKYTRKAGRGEMSDKRHRRFFWVHPYTRTLYWSDQDPAQAGRAQLKAKSVAIEAVRVVVDDNPMPPGLHRKSLLVITPGRDVKFTATTGQRHETWFNALSYLLLRSGQDGGAVGDSGYTPEDVAEFNPATAGGMLRSSRISLASRQSRHSVAPRSHSRASSRDPSPSKPASVIRGSIPAMPHANAGGGGASSAAGRSSRASSSLSSRISGYWRPGGTTVRQLSSRLSGHNHDGGGNRASGSVYSGTPTNDSAEDVRQVLERQEQEADRLENVRACCDGKHDVGSLNRRGTVIRAGSRVSNHAH